MRAVAGRPSTLRYWLTDDVGTPLATDGDSPVEVTIYDGAGVLITGPNPATFNDAYKRWEWPLPPQSKLDALTSKWESTVGGATYTETITVDVVAQRLLEPFQLANDNDLAAIAASDPALLLILVDQVEEGLRDILGFPVVLEAFRTTWDEVRGTLTDFFYVAGTLNGLPYGWGAGKMKIEGVKLPAQIYSGSINGVVLDPVKDIEQLSVEDGCLVWSDYRPWLSGRYSMYGTHGQINPSRELRQVALKLIKHVGKTVDYPDRAFSIVSEGATIMFSMPSPDRPTGLPEVDAVLARLRLQSVI